MILALLGVAFAAPTLGEPVDPFERCREASVAEAGRADVFGEPGASDRVAVVVGAPCHRDPTIPSLAYSSRDAARIADWLEGAGFAVIRLSTVVDRADVERALDAADRALAPDGTLVVYFSGHGVLREEVGRVRRYLVLSDTTFADVPGTGLSVDALDGRLARIDAGHRVVVQDTCFAAQAGDGGKSLGQPVGAKGLPWVALPPEPRPGDLHLYASQFWEQAIESPDYRASVYTHHLLDGLSGRADLDGDGCVGLKEAHAHARAAVVDERGGTQTPEIRSGALDDLVLGCAGTPTRAVVEGPVEPAWRVHLERADGTAVTAVGPAAVDPGRWTLVVDALRGDRVRRVHDGPVRLSAGEWLDVEEQLEARAPTGLVTIGARWADGRELPAWATSAAATWASRDRGWGRLAVGGIAEIAPRAEVDGICAQGSVVRARAGWWGGGDGWAVGPMAGLGPIWRTPRYDGACGGEPIHTKLGYAGEAIVHGHVAVGPVGIALEAGAEVLPFDTREREIHAAPLVRLGIGVVP